MKTETELTKDLCSRLETLGATVRPLMGSRCIRNGWPDRLICYKGYSYLVEMKRRNERLRPSQVSLIGDLAAPAFVLRFWEGQSWTLEIPPESLYHISGRDPGEIRFLSTHLIQIGSEPLPTLGCDPFFSSPRLHYYGTFRDCRCLLAALHTFSELARAAKIV